MTMTTPRGPESTVVRMVANAMHIQNIEVETGWTPDEIKAVAMRNGYALDAASRRFRRAPQPKPAPVGIVRSSQTSTGAEVSGGIEPSGELGDGLALIEQGPATAPVLPDPGAVMKPVPEDPGSAALTPASTTASDPFALAGAAFAELLRAIALALKADPAVPVAHVAAPNPAPRPNGGSTPLLTHGASQSQIRAWARSQGLDVNPRGTVRRDIADAYAAAHPQETP